MGEFSSVIKALKRHSKRSRNEYVLVLDAMNVFISSFISVNSINAKGQHIGGIVGFLKSLGYINRILKPTRIICVFDVKGGSYNRRAINPNYKANRSNQRISKNALFSSIVEEKEAINNQLERLKDYLETLPVEVVTVERAEADDVISYLSQSFSKRGSRVTIVSTDKDFLQILNENISVYIPRQKKLHTTTSIQDKIEVLPINYLIVKAICGDKSDNLPGVRGIGTKTLVKIVPQLKTTPTTLQEIYDFISERVDKKTSYANIIINWDRVKQNYELMNLQTPFLDEDQKKEIISQLTKINTNLNTGAFLHYLQQDYIDGIVNNTEAWLFEFKYLSALKP